MKVILIDDNDSDAELAKLALRDLKDIQLVHVRNFANFKKAFNPDRFAAVISDYNLSGALGTDILDYVRSLDPEFPFIIISGALGEERAVEILRQGATDYVLKDNIQKLPLALNRAINEGNYKKAEKQANNKLRISEEKLNSINSNSPDLMNTVDRNGIITYSNRVLDGFSMEEVIGHSVLDFIPDANKKIYKLHLSQAFKGISQEFEMLGYGKNRVPAWYTIRMAAEETSDKINSVLIISTDITSRKEASLKEEVINNISKELNENTSISSFLKKIRLELNKVFSTENFYVSTYDRPTDEVTFIFHYIKNKPDKQVPFSRKKGNGLSEYIIRTGKSLLLTGDHIIGFQKKNRIHAHYKDTVCWMGVPIAVEQEVVGAIAVLSYKDEYAFRDKDKELLSFVGSQIGAFIARKQAEEKLKDSQVKWDSLVQNSGDFILTLSTDNTINFVNKFPDHFTGKGITMEQLIGQKYETLVSPSHLAQVRKQLQKSLKQKITSSYIMEGRFANNYYDCTATPLVQEGKLQGLIIIMKNITDLIVAQKKIKESEEKFKSVIQDQTEYIVRWKPSGEIIFANQSYVDFSGITLEELYKTNYYSLVPEKELKRFKNKIKSLTPENPVQVDSHQASKGKKGSFWHEWVDRAFFDEKGQVVQYQSVGRDISLQKHAELEIRRSENRYRSLFGKMHEGLLVSAEDGTIKLVNAQFAKMLGYSVDELIGKNGYQLLVDKEDRSLVKAKIKDRKKGVSESYEIKMVKKNREYLYVNFSASPVYNEKDEFTGIMSIVSDISDRRAAEKKLRISYNEIKNNQKISSAVIQGKSLAEISQIIVDGLISSSNIKSSQLYFIDDEKKSLELLGEGSDDPKFKKQKGSPVYSINDIFPSESLFMQVIEKKQMIITTDENEIKKLITGSSKNTDLVDPFPWIPDIPKIRTFGILPITANDIILGIIIFTSAEVLSTAELESIIRSSQQAATALAKKKTEEELRIYKDNLEKLVEIRTHTLNELNSELEAFNYSVSHDLRTPVRAIDIYRGLLAEELKNSELITYINQIEKCTLEMNELIKSLLEFSKMTKTPLSIEQVDLNGLVANLFETQKEYERSPNAVLNLKKMPKVTADRKLITIVFNNLLSNAIKYSSKNKKPVVEVGYTEDPVNYIIYVKDNGVGFNSKLTNKLFKPFSRLHHGDQFKGMGAGLAIVERILRRHSGKIYAESEVNKGAIFYFTLPKVSNHEPQ